MRDHVCQGTNATPSLPSETRRRNSQQQKDLPIAAKRRSALTRSQSERREKNFKEESTSYLQIQSVPITQRVDPERNSYVLVVQPVGVRACGGQYSADEAHKIAKATCGWDWTLDSDGRPRCLPRLEVLLDRICKRVVLNGGEG